MVASKVKRNMKKSPKKAMLAQQLTGRRKRLAPSLAQHSPRCPRVGTFRQLSHRDQSFSHALLLSSYHHLLTHS
jgi:hypothetical protein